MLQRFRHFNKQRVSFFIFILLILSISSVGVFYHINIRQFDWALLIIINNTSLFLLPIYLFKNKLKWYLYLLIPVFVFLPINLASIILFSVPITDSSLLLVINTNVNEALELTKGYLLSFIIGYLLYELVVIYLIKK
jgi:glucan phosphoethanolaminetransferase (alkaline phosphatase superfamily)